MSSTRKHVIAYGSWGCALVGGLVIGLGIAGLTNTLMLARVNEAWMRQITSIVPTAQISSQAYHAYANLQTFVIVLIFVGMVISALGFYSVYSFMKTVCPSPPTIPQPQSARNAETKRSR